MRSLLPVLAVAALGLTVALSAVPPAHAPGRASALSRRRARAAFDRAYVRFLSALEPGGSARAIERALEDRSIDFGFGVNRRSVTPPTTPDPDPDPQPTAGGSTTGSTTTGGSTSGSTTGGSTGGDDPDPNPLPPDWPPDWPWPWPFPWPWPTTTGGDTAGSSGGDTSGYSGGDTSGSSGGDTSGYSGGDSSGSNGGYTSGYDGGSDGGYTGGDSSGSDGGDTSGYDGGYTSGYDGGDSSGYDGGGSTGGTGGTNGGFTGTSGTGGTDGSTSSSGGSTGSTTGGGGTTGSTTGDDSTGGGTTGGGDPPPGIGLGAWWFHWDADSLLGGKKISGTNARMTPKLLIDWNGQSIAYEQFPTVYVLGYTLKFYGGPKGPETVVIPVYREFDAPPGRPDSKSFTCADETLAFASTYFPDGGFTLTISAEILMVDYAGVPTIIDCYKQNVPVAYNRGLTLSTNYENSGGDHFYSVERDGPTDGTGIGTNFATSRRTAKDGRAALKYMNHKLVNDNDELTKAALQTDLKQMTVFLANTHGGANEIDAYSTTNPNPPFVDPLTFQGSPGDIPAAVARPPSIPGPNLVVVHACSTIPDADQHGGMTNAYRAFFGPTAIPDTAYLGFRFSVQTALLDPPDFLDAHANELFIELANGFTVKEALSFANVSYGCAYVPSPNHLAYMPMEYSGDPNSRLMTVYTGAPTPSPDTAQPPIKADVWYQVINP